jgi:hypothetical protein
MVVKEEGENEVAVDAAREEEEGEENFQAQEWAGRDEHPEDDQHKDAVCCPLP